MEHNSNIIVSDVDDIRNMIYTFRGKQVMVDSDLAALYNVETKVFNQAVKRNLNRFPESFRFQLTKEEFKNLRSQFATSSSNKHGGRRYLPYVFTEQGIAMLSAVLKSDIAVEVSIKIIDGLANKDFTMSGEFKWTQETLNKEVDLGTTIIVKSKKLSIRFIKSNKK
ncbi:ORF6N domain-containing protein [Carnobacteriaceae bacterium zg-ZUI78]|nr:ORF6N domain-containing protein [Carnobacteriaceae bacterium zg-ZUI78]